MHQLSFLSGKTIKCFGLIKTNSWVPKRSAKKSDPVSESIFQTLLELWQPRCHDHCAGEPAPVPDHPLSENSKGEKLIYLLLLIHANRIRYDCLLTCVLVLFFCLFFVLSVLYALEDFQKKFFLSHLILMQSIDSPRLLHVRSLGPPALLEFDPSIASF